MIIVLLLVLIVIIFSIPAVQTWAAKKVTANLNETYGTDINIQRLGLNWKGDVDIREVYIADHHQDTLIYSKEVQTNIISFQNLINGELGFGDIVLSHAKLYVKTYKDEANDNLSIFAKKFKTDKPSTTPFSLFSNDVTLNNSRVKISDENLEKPEIFVLDNVNLIANNFNIDDTDVKAEIKTLSFLSSWGIDVKDLQADFSYTETNITLNELYLETTESKLIGDVDLDYSENGMSDFVNEVMITAHFQDSQLSTNDLNSFYNEFGPDQLILLNMDFKGTLNNFVANNLFLETGDTNIQGNYSFNNLLDPEKEYSIVASNHSISSNYFDLRRFMPTVLGEVVPAELKELGGFNFSGNTSIIGNELNTNSILLSSIGQATVSLKMGNIDNIDFAHYKGNVVLKEFNLGRIANTTSLGKMTANLNFDGRGFDKDNVNTEISGTVSSFVFEGYNYKNIVVSGNLKNPLFNGELSINDPNLKLEFKGLIDASAKTNHFDFEADVEFAELNQLNLVTRDSISVFTGKVVVDMDGRTIDDLVGTINFSQTFYQNERDYFYFDDFTVTSTFDGPVRTIEINSPDIIKGQISGEFLIEDIPNLFQNGIASIYANYIPQEVTTNQYIDYEFVVYNKIVDVFVPEIQLGDNTRLKGAVSSDQSKFKLDFRSPEIILFENYIGKLNIQVDNDNPLYNTYISADSVYTGFYNLKNLDIINKTLNDTMYVRTEFRGGQKKEDLFNLSLYHTINPAGKSVIGVKKSDITYKNNVWYLNENNNQLNKVVFDDNFKEIRIDSLVLSHENEVIQMAGIMRDSTYKDFKVRFKDVNIGNITPEVDSLRLNGNMNGSFDFLQKNGAYYPNSAVTIDNVNINEIPFGNLKLNIEGNEDLTKYRINTSLTNNEVKSIQAVGEIDVSPRNPQILLNLDLNQFNMQAFSPFGGEVITDVRGFISGNAKVSGSYKSPDILGRFTLENSGLKIPFLNTDFDIENNSQIIVTKNKFEIARTNITDTKFETQGILYGNATHSNFSEWALNLHVEAPERLLVLNTPKEEDALYYGTAFISGRADIVGPIDELVIDVQATTQPGTTFKIPISDTESISDDSFVHFLSPKEKEARIKGEDLINEEAKGLSLNFDLDINKNAEVEVVVDQQNNSTLKGRGAGILLIEINTNGKFQMYGDFQIYEGLFDFRYGGVIQRNIGVVPGGNITWDGAPEKANLNLSAIYKTQANPSILLDNPSINRKIPVEVVVGLNGQLAQPALKFDIDFPNVSSTLKSELEYKLKTEEQKQNQAIFLLATGNFVNDNYGGSNAFAGTLADRVSSLVNDLFADQDGKFKLGLGYTVGDDTPDQETADYVDVTISTKITERILINGKVGVPVGGANETSVAGDIEVQWLINDDGSLRMTFFNRQADLQFIGEDQIFEQGAGISYSVDFNTFQELMLKLFNKKIEIEAELPVIPDDNSFPVDFDPQAIQTEDESGE
ncbi:translocation/assembly module TamB domain-containing protein [Aequorivita sp. SDUM287046]|uniref:Translocation/assembly module TamB domain-containing protein n=1 Tax=Aequorivita aurantiaca TaxID=3053356 RepID=A0ABT8DF94_9FLAO|nr:translocation/assembly module TamB domain-containing protein [Aequorivita aurantiaca]MDN3723523.1 translocation/assembly module TamB domain-containing protein [Aequorivita aurantiaca]